MPRAKLSTTYKLSTTSKREGKEFLRLTIRDSTHYIDMDAVHHKIMSITGNPDLPKVDREQAIFLQGFVSGVMACVGSSSKDQTESEKQPLPKTLPTRLGSDISGRGPEPT